MRNSPEANQAQRDRTGNTVIRTIPTLEKDGPLLAASFAQERLDDPVPADATPEDPPGQLLW
jgi:hypothetical protein